MIQWSKFFDNSSTEDSLIKFVQSEIDTNELCEYISTFYPEVAQQITDYVQGFDAGLCCKKMKSTYKLQDLAAQALMRQGYNIEKITRLVRYCVI